MVDVSVKKLLEQITEAKVSVDTPENGSEQKKGADTGAQLKLDDLTKKLCQLWLQKLSDDAKDAKKEQSDDARLQEAKDEGELTVEDKKRIDDIISQYRSQIPIGSGGESMAYICVNPYYEEKIDALINKLKEYEYIDCDVYITQLNKMKTDLGKIINCNNEADLNEADLGVHANRHLDNLCACKKSFIGLLKDLRKDKKNDKNADELINLNKFIVDDGKDAPNRSLLFIYKKPIGVEIKKKPVKLFPFNGTDLEKIKDSETDRDKKHRILIEAMQSTSAQLAEYHKKKGVPDQDIKAANIGQLGPFDPICPQGSNKIDPMAGSLSYIHPYLIKEGPKLGNEQGVIHLDDENRLSTVIDARALGLTFISFMPDVTVEPAKEVKDLTNFVKYKEIAERKNDFIDTCGLIKETTDHLKKYYGEVLDKLDGFNKQNDVSVEHVNTRPSDDLADAVAEFIKRMVTVDEKIFTSDLTMDEFLNKSKDVPTDREQVQFFTLLNQLIKRANDKKDNMQQDDITEIIKRLHELAYPTEHVLVEQDSESETDDKCSKELVVQARDRFDEKQLVLASIPDDDDPDEFKKSYTLLPDTTCMYEGTAVPTDTMKDLKENSDIFCKNQDKIESLENQIQEIQNRIKSNESVSDPECSESKINELIAKQKLLYKENREQILRDQSMFSSADCDTDHALSYYGAPPTCDGKL